MIKLKKFLIKARKMLKLKVEDPKITNENQLEKVLIKYSMIKKVVIQFFGNKN